jgi:hypothetical protein
MAKELSDEFDIEDTNFLKIQDIKPSDTLLVEELKQTAQSYKTKNLWFHGIVSILVGGAFPINQVLGKDIQREDLQRTLKLIGLELQNLSNA